MSRLPVLVAACLLVTSPLRAQTAPEAAGHWEGLIQIPDQAMRVTVDVARNAAGAWIGSLSLPGSTTADVPIDDITVSGMAVRFTSALPDRATFEGTLSADGQRITGSATNRMGAVPFQINRMGVADVKVPPPSSPLTKDFEGTWEGTINAGKNVLRLSLKLWAAPDGTALGTLTDDQNEQIPVTTVTIKGMQLQLESRSVTSTYFGTLNASGDIVGNWIQLGDGPSLTFKRTKP